MLWSLSNVFNYAHSAHLEFVQEKMEELKRCLMEERVEVQFYDK